VSEDEAVPDGELAGQPDWAEIYAEHGEAMHRAARGVLGSRAALGVSAEDIVAGVVVELMEKGLPANVRSLRGYLVTATARRAIDAVRRTKHETGEKVNVADHHGDMDREVVDRVLAQAAVDALDHLPERERHALRERVMYRRQAKEVARELGVEPQRVSQLVNAALGRLRRLPTFTDEVPFDPTTEQK
jgi:RNA polymerase sigma factor (sigma-70 family)